MPSIDDRKGAQRENLSSAKAASVLHENWSDQEFREAFESLEIPKELFHHRGHVRLAWIYSCRFPREEAVSRMVGGIKAFAKHHGADGKYHHTITVAWMRLVSHAAFSAPPAPDFNTFAAANPELLDPQLLEGYYSKSRLQSDAARHGWIKPDLRSLP